MKGFEDNRKAKLLEDLKKFMKERSKLGMTWEKYLLVMKEMGQQPDLSLKPVNFDKLSEELKLLIQIYNQMPDIYLGGGMSLPIYAGKNVQALPALFDVFSVPNSSKPEILDLINILDEEPIKKSISNAKKKPQKALK